MSHRAIRLEANCTQNKLHRVRPIPEPAGCMTSTMPPSGFFVGVVKMRTCVRKDCQCTVFVLTKNGPHTEEICQDCGQWQQRFSKIQTGEKRRSVQTTHAAIKPGQRSRILERASVRCEICGAMNVIMHVGHFFSVADATDAGWTDKEINSDENLYCSCEECNLGQGRKPISLRLAIAIVRARLSRGTDS